MFLTDTPLVFMGLAVALTGQVPQPEQNLGFVEISAIESNRSELACAAEETARITVQIWFIGIPDVTTNPKIVTVGLYESWSLPVGIKLGIDRIRKDVQLKRSPAVVEFELRCSKESHSGKIALLLTSTRRLKEWISSGRIPLKTAW